MHGTSSALHASRCSACKNGIAEPLPFSMAFQPVVDTSSQTVFAYEALVRGLNHESAASLFSRLNPDDYHVFDQACRLKAIIMAANLGVPATGASLAVNFMPGAVYSPWACLRQTLRVAHENNFPLSQLMFEVTESEEVRDPAHMERVIAEYRSQGFAIGLDDFGAGFASLNLFSELTLDFVKLDARLVRGIHRRPRTEAIVLALVALCRSLNVRLIAECVESFEEYERLRQCGIDLMQGYLFARPMFEQLPTITWPTSHVPLGKIRTLALVA